MVRNDGLRHEGAAFEGCVIVAGKTVFLQWRL